MTDAERNYRLLQEIDANRRFLLLVYRQNPKLLAQAEPRIRQLLDQPGNPVSTATARQPR